MGNNMYGADIEALRQLADRIARGGEVLDGVVRIVESAMPAPEQWSGADAESFRDEWYGSHGPSIAASAQALAVVVDTLRRNADSQEVTSNELSGVGGGGAGGGGDVGGGGGGGGGGSWGSDAEEPDWFRRFIDDFSDALNYPGLGSFALEMLGSEAWRAFGTGAGAVFSVAGVLTGAYQAGDSMVDFAFSGESHDLYSAGDGWVGAVLSGGSLVPPVAPAFAIAGAAWGGLSIVNGLVSDRPLTQNLVDTSLVGSVYNDLSDTELSEDLADAAHAVYKPVFWTSMEIAEDAIDVAGSAADAVGNAANDIVDGGRDLIRYAGGPFGF